MAIGQRRLTLDEFLALPEEKPALELEPDRTVVQKVWPKGQHSRLQYSLCGLINAFAEPPRLAMALPELRDIFGGAAYVPDVSVYRWARIPRLPNGDIENDFRLPPDLAIEIASPEQSVNRLVRRCVWYVENGVHIALLIDPADRSVLVFREGASPTRLGGTDRIDLDEVLPGFQLTPGELFETLKL